MKKQKELPLVHGTSGSSFCSLFPIDYSRLGGNSTYGTSLKRLDKGHKLLSMCLGLLRYIGVRGRKLSVEREGLDVLHTAVVNSGLKRCTDGPL